MVRSFYLGLILLLIPLGAFTQSSSVYLGAGSFDNYQFLDRLASQSPGMEIGYSTTLIEKPGDQSWDLVAFASAAYWRDFLDGNDRGACADCTIYEDDSFLATVQAGPEASFFRNLKLAILPGFSYQFLRSRYHGGEDPANTTPEDSRQQHFLNVNISLDLSLQLTAPLALYSKITRSQQLLSKQNNDFNRNPETFLTFGLRHRF